MPVDIMFSSFSEDAGLEERPFSHQTKPIVKAWPDPSANVRNIRTCM
jgi:acetolactate synthase-1/2/3 large subunit